VDDVSNVIAVTLFLPDQQSMTPLHSLNTRAAQQPEFRALAIDGTVQTWPGFYGW